MSVCAVLNILQVSWHLIVATIHEIEAPFYKWEIWGSEQLNRVRAADSLLHETPKPTFLRTVVLHGLHFYSFQKFASKHIWSLPISLSSAWLESPCMCSPFKNLTTCVRSLHPLSLGLQYLSSSLPGSLEKWLISFTMQFPLMWSFNLWTFFLSQSLLG